MKLSPTLKSSASNYDYKLFTFSFNFLRIDKVLSKYGEIDCRWRRNQSKKQAWGLSGPETEGGIFTSAKEWNYQYIHDIITGNKLER